MKEIVSTITSKGQVTIPIEVRRHLGVREGDKLSFVIDDTGTVGLKVPSYPTVASLRERGPGLSKDLSYDEMEESGVKTIYSYDTDFDRMPGVRRQEP